MVKLQSQNRKYGKNTVSKIGKYSVKNSKYESQNMKYGKNTVSKIGK
jgi:hypothetical protein